MHAEANLCKMKLVFLILSAYTVPTLCGVKPLDEHFNFKATGKPLSPQTSVDSKDPDLESIQMQFHKDNTLTQDLLPEGEEDDEYLDFDALLGEDDDYIDAIDEIDVPEIVTDFEPSDPATKRAKLLKLFRGKTRIQRLNTVNSNFAFDLYRSIRNAVDQSDNILLAPAGISITLGMVSLGARHETHRQLFNAIGFADFVNASVKYDTMTVHNLFRRLTHRLFRHNFGYTLRAVNNLFIRQDAQILSNFTQNMKTYYFVEPQSANFSDSTLINKLNGHILKITKGLIKEALKTIDPQTLIMILNCFYLKGTWETKFPVENTYTGSFRLNEKKVVRVPLMHTKGNFLAAADHKLDCDILQLLYVGNISMLVVLPRKFSGMRIVETQLTSEVVGNWLDSMTNRTRKVVLPRFNLVKYYDLVPYLKTLGLTLPFQAVANFTGISTKENLGINLFKHQGALKVNEEGTTAASVTTVGFMPLSMQNEFSVNRPFLFLIYEHRTECLLYMGRVTNPLND